MLAILTIRARPRKEDGDVRLDTLNVPIGLVTVHLAPEGLYRGCRGHRRLAGGSRNLDPPSSALPGSSASPLVRPGLPTIPDQRLSKGKNGVLAPSPEVVGRVVEALITGI
jgi:hypothetical protein